MCIEDRFFLAQQHNPVRAAKYFDVQSFCTGFWVDEYFEDEHKRNAVADQRPQIYTVWAGVSHPDLRRDEQTPNLQLSMLY